MFDTVRAKDVYSVAKESICQGMDNKMHLYAIRYAENFKYGTYGSVYRNHEQADRTISRFTFLYYLAEYKGQYTLIDTGFRDKALAADMGVTLG